MKATPGMAEASGSEAEQFRRLAEEAREARDQHRGELETIRDERERLRATAEAARGGSEEARLAAETARHAEEDARVVAEAARHSSEEARMAAEDARHAVVDAVRATAETLGASLEQMKVVEEMRLKKRGYTIHIVYLWLPTAELAIARVAERVRAGGHDVPSDDVRRRFSRARRTFFTRYRPLADTWHLYDGSSIRGPRLIASGVAGKPTRVRDQETWRLASGN